VPLQYFCMWFCTLHILFTIQNMSSGEYKEMSVGDNVPKPVQFSKYI
jgi:hypothetical protein